MLLSQSCMYGIRAAILVTAKGVEDPTNFLPIKQISDELNVSFHYLTKILQVLTKAKIMESYKGPNGGIRLSRDADSIFLNDIIEAVDGSEIFSKCILGLPECSDEKPCPIHSQCDESMVNIQKLFKEMSLAKLASETKEFKFNL